MVSAGVWGEMVVRLLAVPSFDELLAEPVGGDILVRSVLLTRFDAHIYLLCALGDGQLVYFLYANDGRLIKFIVINPWSDVPSQARSASARR